MISWAEYNAQQKRLDTKIADLKSKEGEQFSVEMCDVCGRNLPGIRRASFISKSGMQYIIRYCENCNPVWRWNMLNI